jgi:hypothetical protein
MSANRQGRLPAGLGVSRRGRREFHELYYVQTPLAGLDVRHDRLAAQLHLAAKFDLIQFCPEPLRTHCPTRRDLVCARAMVNRCSVVFENRLSDFVISSDGLRHGARKRRSGRERDFHRRLPVESYFLCCACGSLECSSIYAHGVVVATAVRTGERIVVMTARCFRGGRPCLTVPAH